jgi:hypothetical protein
VALRPGKHRKTDYVENHTGFAPAIVLLKTPPSATNTKPRQKLTMLPDWAFATNHTWYQLVISPAPHISTSKSSMTSSTAKIFSPCTFSCLGAGSLS